MRIGMPQAIARSLGVFVPARKLYRKISPLVRKQVQDDREFYSSFLRQGSLVFDVGANMGQKSDVFLELGANVVAIEPNPECAKYLKDMHGKNPKFHLIEKAVGEKPGEAILTFAHTETTGSLRPDWQGLESASGNLLQQTVEVTTLQALVDQFGVPDFCKIDVEGFEFEVVSGLEQQLVVLSLEFHANEPERILRSIDKLEELGRVQLNAIQMNGKDFIFKNWVSREQFAIELSSGKLPRVGDALIHFQ